MEQQIEVDDYKYPRRGGEEAYDGHFGVDDRQADAFADQEVHVGASDGDDDHIGTCGDEAEMEHADLLRGAVRALQQLLGVRRVHRRSWLDGMRRCFHG